MINEDNLRESFEKVILDLNDLNEFCRKNGIYFCIKAEISEGYPNRVYRTSEGNFNLNELSKTIIKRL